MARLVSLPDIDIEIRISKLGRGPSGQFEIFEFELITPMELDLERPWKVIDAAGQECPVVIKTMGVAVVDGAPRFRGIALLLPDEE